MKKYFLLFALAIGAAGCTLSDPVREPSPEDIPCGAYFLAADRAANINLPVATVEATDTRYSYFLGRTNNQGDVTVNLVNHSDPCFTVPSSVTFKNGEYTAELVISFASVPPEDTPVKIEVDPAFVSLYAAGSSKLDVALNCLWENLGIGQYYCGLFEGYWDVQILKSKVDPIRYRVLNVYTKEWTEEVGLADWFDKSMVPEFLEFTVSAQPTDEGGQLITWDKYFFTGVCYQGATANPILGCMPSAMSKEGDEESCVLEGFDGKLFQIVPYFIADGLGSFGLIGCYLSLPGGPDLGELLF